MAESEREDIAGEHSDLEQFSETEDEGVIIVPEVKGDSGHLGKRHIVGNTANNEANNKKHKDAAAYKSKYQNGWQKKWPCIAPLKDRPNYFQCTVCSKAVSCGHQGEADVKRHIASSQHQRTVESIKCTVPLPIISSSLKKKVIKYQYYIECKGIH